MGMSTTSLKLTDELKARAASVAQERGVSPHAFMVEAIAQATAAAEQRAAFVAEALAADAEMLATGRGYDADEVHAWLRARAAGQSARKPRLKSWRT
jgi:predicted transcriptional regulator